MKKILTAAAALVLLFSSSAFAQNKGDMVVSGTFGINAASKGSETELDLGIQAGFGYFFMDNFVGKVSLGLSHARTADGDYAMNGNSFDVTPEVSYYLHLGENFYYTPAVSCDLSFGKSNLDGMSTKVFAWRANLNFASFEYRITSDFAIAANLGGMYFGNVRYKSNDSSKAVFGFSLLSECALGARFYF